MNGAVRAPATVAAAARRPCRRPRPPLGAPCTCSAMSVSSTSRPSGWPCWSTHGSWPSAGGIEQVKLAPPDHPPSAWMDAPPDRPRRAAASMTRLWCRAARGRRARACRAHRCAGRARDIGGRVRRRPGTPRPGPVGPCLVAAARDRCGGRVALRTAPEPVDPRPQGRPGVDEARWRLHLPGRGHRPGEPGRHAVRDPAAQVLYGLQQRTRSAAHTRVQMLRDGRGGPAPPAGRLGIAHGPTARWGGRSARCSAALARHAALALSDPETEKAKDV